MSDHRVGGRATETKAAGTGRSEFHKDYDRIIFSSAFRRLSDKTQVVPLPRSDYTRQRLTHSLEVSCVGRSLATLVYELVDEDAREVVAQGDFEAIVAAACLAHDIGNPPFGHFGEKAIQDWAVALQDEGRLEGLTPAEAADLVQFEGNAQSFRVLTRLQMGIRRGGMRLTGATLGALMKYPCSSAETSKQGYKKHGYYQDDEELFREACEVTGMKRTSTGEVVRHPLAYLSEAADDICYAIIDLEDGCRAGLVKEESALSTFEALAKDCTGSSSMPLADRLSMGRAIAINKLVTQSAEVFSEHRSQILEGTFQGSLVGHSGSSDAYQMAKEVAIKEYFNSEIVLAMEATGYRAIQGLLQLLSHALTVKQQSSFDRHVLKLLKVDRNDEATLYNKLLTTTDSISSLTDRHTIQLYRTLTGHALPG
ncbi:MAG: dGTP triphosphohydrolase [Fuerstiella sp.]